jgi:transcription elongation factor GreB
MNKAFTREPETDEDADEADASTALNAVPTGQKNYMTPQGYARLRGELNLLLDEERPKVVEAVSWAAKNGDRSENGDYIYGKKRLREIDRRVRFLIKRLDIAEVVDPSCHYGSEQVFFGATVHYLVSERLKSMEAGGVDQKQHVITIKGIDESDSLNGEVSWIAPIARALLKASVGDEVNLMTPGGMQVLEVLEVTYPAPTAKAKQLP